MLRVSYLVVVNLIARKNWRIVTLHSVPTDNNKSACTASQEAVAQLTSKLGFVARLWYYFRIGYSTYLTFILGYVSTLVTVYYLAIKNLPSLLDIFPHFVPFAVLATVVGGPLSVFIGWLHLKRSPAFSAEVDIGVEANPYNYKLPPGYYREALFPLYLELLTQMKRLLLARNALAPEDTIRIDDLEQKLPLLIQGGFVGIPRRSDMQRPTQ